MFRRSRPCRIVFDGQSRIMSPPFAGVDLAGVLSWSWGRLVTAGKRIGVYPVGISGTSMTSLASTFASRAAPHIAPASFEPTIYVLCGGHTDYAGEHDTGAQVYADAGTLAALARAAGAQYVVCTTTLPSVAIAGTDETQRQAGNALILADAAGHFDATVDFDVPGLTDTGDPTAYVDGVHLWGAQVGRQEVDGTGRVAVIAQPAIDAAIEAVTA